MIEVKEIENGRFEVYAEDLHHEVFQGRLGAQLASVALATALAAESGAPVIVVAPWGKHSIECSSGQRAAAQEVAVPGRLTCDTASAPYT
ncbi:hypothetical protein [Luteimonas sp. 3794]|uniref:hypothetical protein n=1 Tax=Luteimonas sp. 3794 TaxID=2817730 RepID=UPI002858078F|nr:hypothetical protein [Luteimonas sp. 3794]MDR6990212.1 putative phage-like protein YoqJ [Luteimonas sp. 3794]